MAKLKRTLGLGECIFFGVGSILGAGIYAMIGKAAAYGGTMLWVSFLFGAVAAILTALSYAELSSMFPKAGGEYAYARKAIGKRTALFLGSMVSMNGIITGATVSLGFAGYFTNLLDVPLLLAAIGIITLILLINISGIRESSTINVIFTIIELSGLILVIIAAAPKFGSVDYFEVPEGGFEGLGIAAALVFFAYIGFEDIVKLAEETREPKKNIPRALMISGAIVAVVYTLIAISVVSVLPIETAGASSGPLAEVLRIQFGTTAAVIISIIALFSTSNTILSNMLGSSRVILNMSSESRVFALFSYISPRFRSPVITLVSIAVVMSALSLIGDIRVVAFITTYFIYATFLTVNLCVIILRKKNPSLSRPFRIPVSIGFIPVTTILAILLTLVLLGFSIYGMEKL